MKKTLGSGYPDANAAGNGGKTPLSVWYAENPEGVGALPSRAIGW